MRPAGRHKAGGLAEARIFWPEWGMETIRTQILRTGLSVHIEQTNLGTFQLRNTRQASRPGRK